MNDEPYLAIWWMQRRQDRNESRLASRDERAQDRETGALNASQHLRCGCGGPQRPPRLTDHPPQPLGLGQVVERRVEPDEVVVLEIRGRARRSSSGEIALARVKTLPQSAAATSDQRRAARAHESNRDVCLAAREVERTRFRSQVERESRVGATQLVERRQEQVVDESVAGSQACRSGDTRVGSR